MSLPVVLPSMRPREDAIEKLKHGIEECSSMCRALGTFLASAFPNAVSEAKEFSYWLERYLNHNSREYIETLLNPPPLPPGYSSMSWDPTENLVQLCKRRDTMQEQLDAFNNMCDKVGDSMGEDTRSMLDAQLRLSGLPQQLEELNEQISNLQRQIETKAATK